MKNQLKTPAEIEAMRVSGRMLAEVLQFLAERVVPGVTTKELANQAAKELKKLGGEPAFLGYNGYPDVICISVNDEVVHAIPSEKVLQEGDLVSLDFGVTYKGMITDGAISLVAGRPESEQAKLIGSTAASLEDGIAQAVDGARVGDISAAIEQCLRKSDLAIIENLVGHGVGHHLHEEPPIPNFGPAGRGPRLKAGMTIAIEPMATLGSKEVEIDEDGWTIRTIDGSLAAHFEHTVLITTGGPEILTRL